MFLLKISNEMYKTTIGNVNISIPNWITLFIAETALEFVEYFKRSKTYLKEMSDFILY